MTKANGTYLLQLISHIAYTFDARKTVLKDLKMYHDYLI